MSFSQKVRNKLRYEIKKLLDHQEKKDQILFGEPWNLEVNMVEMANYLAKKIKKPIYFAVPKRLMISARKILDPSIQLINHDNWIKFHATFYASKYYFTAHWKKPSSYSSKQTIINLWHGIPYKKINHLHGKGVGSVSADITLATSPLTKAIFSKAFGVKKKNIFIGGYPRNDALIRSSKSPEEYKRDIKDFNKIVIWLPTWRKDFVGGHKTYGHPVNNAFQVESFKIKRFNQTLKEESALCIVKPHPLAMQKEPSHDYSNILFINDQWLWNQGITLYDLVGCTDALISDVSSIIIDYLLIDKPIICLSTDFEQYKKERGFVFDDLEDWMPTKILKTQEEFFSRLQSILKTGEDEFSEKRKKLRDQFFTYQDDQSARRLTEYIFKKNSK